MKLLLTAGCFTGEIVAREIIGNGHDCHHYMPASAIATYLTFDEFTMDVACTKQISSCLSIPFSKVFYSDISEDSIEKFKKEGYDAIIPMAELGVIAACTIADKLCLASNDIARIKGLTDKYEMQKLIQNAGLTHMKYGCVSSQQEAIEWFRKSLAKKIILKPTKSSSTVGFEICSTDEEIIQYFQFWARSDVNALSQISSNKIIIEEFLESYEYGVTCLSHNSKHLCEYVYLYNKHCLHNTLVYDAALMLVDNDYYSQNVIEYAKKSLTALGIKYGPSHVEIKMNQNAQPVLIETSARPIGSMSLIKPFDEALGHAFYKELINCYTDDVSAEKHYNSYKGPIKYLLVKYLISYKNAVLHSLPSIKIFEKFSTLSDFDLDGCSANMKIKVTIDGLTKPGMVIFVGSNLNDIYRDYLNLKFLETKHPELLYNTKKDYIYSQAEKDILKNINKKLPATSEISRLHQDIIKIRKSGQYKQSPTLHETKIFDMINSFFGLPGGF